MNITTKTIAVSGSLIAVAAIAFASTSAVLADSENGQNGFGERFAKRLGLSSEEVKEQRQVRQQDNLSQAVADGKITEEQKNLLLEKHQEMDAKRQQNRELSAEERQAAREKNRAEMQAWAEQNGIDLESIRPDDAQRGNGPREGRGMHR
jgi:hypothetical protein